MNEVGAADAAAGPRHPARTALLRTAGTLYLPALLPFVFGPLTECGHCVRVYLAMLVVEPGVLLGVLLGLGGAWFFVAAGAGTALLFAGVAALMRVAGAAWTAVALSFGALSGAQAIVFSHVLRA